MLAAIKIPGRIDIQVIRKLSDADASDAGIKILRRSRRGKVAVIARDHQGNTYLCSLASDILKPKDLRFLMSSSEKVLDYFYSLEEPFPAPALASPASLFAELCLLEKKFRTDKSAFLAPACVERQWRVRRFARHLDKLIARAKAYDRKAQNLSLRAQRAAEKSNKTAEKALRTAARIDML